MNNELYDFLSIETMLPIQWQDGQNGPKCNPVLIRGGGSQNSEEYSQ